MNISTLFLDIGGVLLSNGFGRSLRKQVIEHFSLEEKDFNDRHDLIFPIYEIGKLNFEEYLQTVIFFQKRPFSLESVKKYILNAAIDFPEMISMIKEMKEKFKWKIVAVTNEGEGLIEDRIERFHLKNFIDAFVISSKVGLRKPDWDIYRLGLNIAQCKPEEVIYLDDRKLLVEQALSLGIHGICHRDVLETRNEIEARLFTNASI